MQETLTQHAGNGQVEEVHIGGRPALGEDRAAAVGVEKEVRVGLQSPRLCEHVTHQEDGVGPRPSDPPVPAEARSCLQRLVMEMVCDKEEGVGQPATLFGIIAASIDGGDPVGKRAHGPGGLHPEPAGAVLVREVLNVPEAELAGRGQVLVVGVNAGTTHAVLIPHDTKLLDPNTEVLHPCFLDARPFIGPQQLSDARQFGLSDTLRLGEAPVVRHGATPSGHFLGDDRVAAKGKRVVLDEVEEHGPCHHVARRDEADVVHLRCRLAVREIVVVRTPLPPAGEL